MLRNWIRFTLENIILMLQICLKVHQNLGGLFLIGKYCIAKNILV